MILRRDIMDTNNFLFLKAYENIKVLEKKILKTTFPDIKIKDLYIINLIGKNQINVSEISIKLDESVSMISSHLNNLEKKKYISRNINKNDRRNTNISLNTKGLEVYKKYSELYSTVLKQFSSSLSSHEKNDIQIGLRKVIKFIDKLSEDISN